ncbi:MAG: Nramp family divalent metal transporter [Candidatus Krumholzibacteriia bacterium]
MDDPRETTTPTTPEAGTVAVPTHPSFWRRLFAFIGPAYLVSVGYMDPGNWATDIAAGSRFGYALIWVLLMSNIMAVLLQSLSARLGIVTRMDLAQACRTLYRRPVVWALWILCEIAIAACDLAEVLGTAIGLQLLFGLPLLVGVVVTALDSLILLVLHSRGVRMMEAFIVALITTIGVCLGLEVVLARPEWGALATGFVPTLPGEGALFLAIGILGATVMPHNLYLHSGLVQSRRIARVPAGVRSGIRFNLIDSVVALNGAFFVNAALLVVAAATFYTAGRYEVAEIQDAHRLLEPLLGAHIAPVAFAIALIASGQASTITGTLAGQIVMEGFVQIRMRPIARRLLTRALAIVPAVLVIALAGEGSTGELLLLSQVILSLQLSFAVVPLVLLVSDRRWMGQYVIKPWVTVSAWLVAGVIAVLNIKLAVDEIAGWMQGAGQLSWLLWVTVIPLSVGLAGLLVYITVAPLLARRRGDPTVMHHGIHGPMAVPAVAPPHAPHRIAAAVDFSSADAAVLSYAVTLARAGGRRAEVVLLHVVESGGARLLGDDVLDHEAHIDQERLELYTTELTELGVQASFDLGFGEPADQLARLVKDHASDLVVVGSHGHRGMADFIRGTSVERLRHQVNVPVMVVPAGD